ncbi:hypothetical protein [Hymenobacter norwichensis]|uniref:hypothetical protein n=1 Tax=Hymenobacter norwichensis TaxID=223903 RepID=UPI0003B2E21C|nr:hypothetical protein [Hymenobacter norwichensis]
MRHKGRRYPALNQPGTGNTNGFVYVNYIGSYRDLGLRVNGSYRRGTANRFEESLALGTAAFANLLHAASQSELSATPFGTAFL